MCFVVSIPRYENPYLVINSAGYSRQPLSSISLLYKPFVKHYNFNEMAMRFEMHVYLDFHNEKSSKNTFKDERRGLGLLN